MTWPTASCDTLIADAIAAAFAAMVDWRSLDPLDGSVFTLSWPTTLPAGPRALVHAPTLTEKSEGAGAYSIAGTVSIAVYLQVEISPALAALGRLRRALLRDLSAPGIRVQYAKITDLENGMIEIGIVAVQP
jgi:hypothetical protein